ncbi:MAG: hypothetical protein J7500_06980 [Sphingomonas sp.]|uniref:hypothetical protein n=1 Tax=Sphingomonas sp. TaxID=28214 RepID=UPI001B0914EA|nr:hypothetical protein [Sphingomonas sp.]MBO9622438.1 hypothetical protein [Sphingomonas sp.]
MVQIVSQTRIRSNVYDAPNVALAERLRLFSEDVLAWAGIDSSAPSLERARAIVGWVAAHAVHPDSRLHPASSTAHTDVLPVGETWATFNAEFDNATNIQRDLDYWYALFPDGITMLEKLIGTVDSQGNVADDGMLVRDDTQHWRIRNFQDFRAVQCTLQCKMAQPLLAVQGIPSQDISTVSHDPMIVYIAEEARWIYIDPTFGEVQTLDGELLDPLELVTLSLAGRADEIVGIKLPGADYLDGTYFSGDRLPAGMSFMTVHTAPHWAGGSTAREPYRFGDLPSQSDYWDVPGTAEQILPQLGCGFAGVRAYGTTVEVRLVGNWPDQVGFERSTDGGATWNSCYSTDYPLQGVGEISYRSVDAMGSAGTSATVTV